MHARDGWEAPGALLPPREARRGLTLIDPPFEQPGEFDRIADAIHTARRRFGGRHRGRLVSDQAPGAGARVPRPLRETAEPDLVCAELLLRPPLDAARLNGCGLLVASPPWGFEAAAIAILDAIADGLGESGAHGSLTRITPELVA